MINVQTSFDSATLHDFYIGIIINFIAAILVLTLFCIINPFIFSKEDKKAQSLLLHSIAERADLDYEGDKGLWIRIKLMFKITDKELINRCYKDGFLYLLFLRYLCIYFCIISFAGCGILIPTYMENETKDNDLLSNYTIANVSENWKLWIVLGFTILYSLTGFFFLYLFNERIKLVAEVKNRNPLNILCNKLAFKITNIPTDIIGETNEVQIQELVEKIVGRGGVISVRIVGDYRSIYKLLIRKNYIIEKLEKVKKTNMEHDNRVTISKGICCFKVSADAESEYTNQLNKLQNKPEALNFENKSKQSLGIAFIVFKTVEQALLAQNIITWGFQNASKYSHLNFDKWKIVKAPLPSNILWKNLGATTCEKVRNYIIFNLILAVVVILMIIPVILLAELKAITCLLYGKTDYDDIDSGWLKSFVDNYGPALVLCLDTSLFVPLLVEFTVAREYKEKKSSLTRSMLSKLSIYLIFNILILPSLGINTLYSLFARYDWYF